MVRVAAHAHWTRVVSSQGGRFFHARGAAFSSAFVVLESGPGDQIAFRCEPAPIDTDSHTISSAERRLTPGMVFSISMAARKGSTLLSTSSIMRPMAAFNASNWSPQPVIKRKHYAEQFHLDPSSPG